MLVEFAASVGSAPRVTDIRLDLARFDNVFGLPVANLQVINSLARSPSPWMATTACRRPSRVEMRSCR